MYIFLKLENKIEDALIIFHSLPHHYFSFSNNNIIFILTFCSYKITSFAL